MNNVLEGACVLYLCPFLMYQYHSIGSLCPVKSVNQCVPSELSHILQKIWKSKTLISMRFLVLKNDKSLDVLERIILISVIRVLNRKKKGCILLLSNSCHLEKMHFMRIYDRV